MTMFAGEMAAKSIGLIIPQQEELETFYGLTTAQQGYFLHWVRSNWRRFRADQDWFARGVRKAREQRV